MIFEILESLLTPCPPWHQRKLFLKDSAAIRARHARCSRAWAPHLARSQSFLLSQIPSRQKKICILGSGHLFDIPWKKLANLAEHLWLIDTVHPLPVLLLALRNPSIHLAYADLTFPSPPPSSKKTTCAGHPVFFSSDSLLQTIGSCDTVVSCNLLSQLEPFPPLPLSATTQQHLSLLNALAKQKILLSDVALTETTPDGSISHQETLVDTSLLPPPIDSWEWLLAPPGEMLGSSRQHSDTRRIQAFAWSSPS